MNLAFNLIAGERRSNFEVGGKILVKLKWTQNVTVDHDRHGGDVGRVCHAADVNCLRCCFLFHLRRNSLTEEMTTAAPLCWRRHLRFSQIKLKLINLKTIEMREGLVISKPVRQEWVGSFISKARSNSNCWLPCFCVLDYSAQQLLH